MWTVLDWITPDRILTILGTAGEWGIVITILIEGKIALKEYRSARLFEAIKYLEDTETRKARRVVYERLVLISPMIDNWWDEDHRLAEAAATVCARY